MKKFAAAVLSLILAGSTFAVAEIKQAPTLGLELDIPESIATSNYMLQEINDGNALGISVTYVNSDVLLPISNDLKEAMADGDNEKFAELQSQFTAAYTEHAALYYEIIGLKTDDLEAERAKYGITDENATEIGTNSTRTYYLCTAGTNNTLSEEDRTLMEASRAEVEAIAASVKIIEVAETNTDDTVSDLASFSTVDMNGNAVTQDIFKNADLTILNIWGTYCAPCINEMPELAKWSNELPEGVQIVGLIIDVGSTSDNNFSKAEKILSKSGATFTNILYNDSLSAFVNNITGTPTTLFIDKNGNSVHEMIVGANMTGYKAAVEEILSK